MKVVLLAGGLGTRMREETEFRPKPMVEIGNEPLLWHLMRIFALHGYSDFLICAGYRAEIIGDYFNGDRWRRKAQELVKKRPSVGVSETDWTVSVIDTGNDTPTGGRLKAVEALIDGDRFMCTYGDGLAPVDISRLVDAHNRRGKRASVTLTRPSSRFGIADLDDDGLVRGFKEKPVLDELVSIGFFVFEREVLASLAGDSVLEGSPLSALAAEGQLSGFIHDAYWQPIDTYRELLAAKKLWENGEAPWSATGSIIPDR